MIKTLTTLFLSIFLFVTMGCESTPRLENRRLKTSTRHLDIKEARLICDRTFTEANKLIFKERLGKPKIIILDDLLILPDKKNLAYAWYDFRNETITISLKLIADNRVELKKTFIHEMLHHAQYSLVWKDIFMYNKAMVGAKTFNKNNIESEMRSGGHGDIFEELMRQANAIYGKNYINKVGPQRIKRYPCKHLEALVGQDRIIYHNKGVCR
jgi:hypothetical protein